MREVVFRVLSGVVGGGCVCALASGAMNHFRLPQMLVSWVISIAFLLHCFLGGGAAEKLLAAMIGIRTRQQTEDVSDTNSDDKVARSE